MKARRSGILLHITSLPSEYGIGDFGPGAYAFADFLSDAGQSLWQILPFGPSSGYCGNSPYCGFSAFAGNPLFISPQKLVEQRWLDPPDLEGLPAFGREKTQYEAAADLKKHLLKKAFVNFSKAPGTDCGFDLFCRENASWLDDFALFTALKREFEGQTWGEWPAALRDRHGPDLDQWSERLKEEIIEEKFYQFVFFRQWSELKSYCNQKSIQVLGDIPIYVSCDSADVWSNPDYFKLDEHKRPLFVSGVPPDYFSATGQLWGNPVYDWGRLKKDSYRWWLRRFEHNLEHLDAVRLDHFRGLVAYWEIPATEKTAINGQWVEVPARDFFDTMQRRFPILPVIAEDLGIITPAVREIMKIYGFPGMKVLQFGFGGDGANPYIPHNHIPDSVIYTGTHDNNTTRGWFTHDATPEEKKHLFSYLGRTVSEITVARELIRLAMMSVADTAVIPMQDFLGLGVEARINKPSTTYGNWEWRVLAEQITPALAENISEMSALYGRR